MKNGLTKGVYYVTPFGKKPLDETIDGMVNVLDKERLNPYVIHVARSMILDIESHNTTDEIERIFTFVRDGVRYTKDPLDIEYLVYPSLLIERILESIKDYQSGKNKKFVQYASGDCDDHTLLLCCLLLSVGIPCKAKVISQDKKSDYHHIYVIAFDEIKNRWIPLDPIHKNWDAGREIKYQKEITFDVGIVEAYD
jgi:transglutaminase-like putative cysteine protease